MPAYLRPARIATLVVIAAALSVVTAGAPAHAATTDGVAVFPGFTAFESSVSCAGKAPRSFSSEQSATFLQSWLADSIYKTLPKQTPPARLPVCTLVMEYAGSNGTRQPALHIYYATDGHSAWLSSDRKKWIVAPQSQRVINSFEGRGVYQQVVPSGPVPTSTVPTASKAPLTKASHSAAVPTVVAVVGVALVALVGLYILRRRSR